MPNKLQSNFDPPIKILDETHFMVSYLWKEKMKSKYQKRLRQVFTNQESTKETLEKQKYATNDVEIQSSSSKEEEKL